MQALVDVPGGSPETIGRTSTFHDWSL